jgi:histidine triad (HIT) family protein
MTDCIFCKIINNEIPCHRIYEDREFLVILDAFPCSKGQTLVLPKKHIEYAFDLDESTWIKLMSLTKNIGKAIDKALGSKRTVTVIEGFEVPHAHVRLHPFYGENFSIYKKMEALSEEEMKEIASNIKFNLSGY